MPSKHSEQNIRTINFEEKIPDELINTNYLRKYKFDKTLPTLIKKLKNKKVILYGAGSFLALILKNFDLSNLDILGVADRRFVNHKENEKWYGLKAYSIEEMKIAKPDYVLVATKFYINIIEDLYYNVLKDTRIKIKPLMKKPFITLVKEMWE